MTNGLTPLNIGIMNADLNKKYCVGLGEILFDVFPTGSKLGGAPANFAYHAGQHGLHSVAVSAIGNDALGDEYRFVMVAKGGGSANKTYFYPMTKATIQNEGTLLPFLVEKMKSLGTAACPPYHIAFVIGGTSAEKNLLTVKLASIKYYDELPTTGDETGRAFRDIDLEQKLLEEAHKIGLGAQFGGKYLAHDIRVIRLPRHGASCPIGMGVSCSADRNIKAKINKDGIWLEDDGIHAATEVLVEERNQRLVVHAALLALVLVIAQIDVLCLVWSNVNLVLLVFNIRFLLKLLLSV